MFSPPPTMPDTTPVVEPTLATSVLLLLQSPPGAALVSVIVCPVQTPEGPVVAANAVTVSALVA